MQEFKVPELGENVEQGDVTRVLVKVGDTIQKEQPVVELETDKATVEVPSSVAGVVKEIKVKAGDKVKVGSVILTVDENGAGASKQEEEKEEKEEKDETPEPEQKAAPEPAPKAEQKAGKAGQKAAKAEQKADEAEEEADEVEEKADEAEKADTAEEKPEKAAQKPQRTESKPEKIVSMPRREPPQPAAAQEQPRAAAASPKPQEPATKADAAKAGAEPRAAEGAVAPASPSVRRLAREIGVDINEVQGSGPGGRISDEDVKEHARRILSSIPSTGLGAGPSTAPGASGFAGRPAGVPAAGVPLPDFSKWGEIEREPMSNIRRKTAEHLSRAWTTIPHVTQFDKADITPMEALRAKFRKQVEEAGGNLTVTAVLVKVIAAAVKQFPQFNASLDIDNNAIVYKKYINVGVAVDTPFGLLVPVIRDADQKNITEIAVELHQLSEKARAKKLTRDEMSGGGISISNLGGIGGTYFTPIVNWPEVAILGVSRGIIEAVFIADRSGEPSGPPSNGPQGRFEPRQLLPLSLSYDHRVIDGADAMRFLRWVVQAIEQPFLLSLLG